MEVLEGYFHFDTKIVNTLRDLIFRPGIITRNYNEGKRARYVSPIKFYIFVSFILFLIISLQNPEKKQSLKRTGESTAFNFAVIPIDKVTKQVDLVRLEQNKDLDNNTIESYLDSVGIKTRWYNRTFIQNYIKVKTGHITATELRHKIRRTFSTIMFLLMPIFAFYLFVFHYKLKMYYSESLVFSIHFHSMAFLVLIIWFLSKTFLSGIWLLLVFVPFILIHLGWSTKVIYNQNVGVVVYKLVLISLLYIFTLLIFVAMTFILSLV